MDDESRQGSKRREHFLTRWALQSAARELMRDERVAQCLRRIVPGRGSVHVCYSPKVHRAHYKNLVVCGSVWMCPICAAKITERRRVELSSAIDDKDFRTALVTFTIQHTRDDKLKDLLGDLMSAFYFLRRHRRWREFVGDYKMVGSVRSLEVTHGFVNGWHPHSHGLMLFPGDTVFDSSIESDLKNLWRDALAHFERSASYARGVDFRTSDKDLSEYVAKWGREPLDKKRPKNWTQEHELVKAGSKISRSNAHRTMNQILLDYLVFNDDVSASLWKEYARVFKGRKQLVWSPGLRAKLDLGRLESDQEVAERIEEDAILLAVLALSQWRKVLANDARGELLEIASSGDVAQVQAFLVSIGAGSS